MYTIFTCLIVSFFMVFVAELGDKSQFMAITFGIRYPGKTVFIGISIAAIIITGLAVLMGRIVVTMIPHWCIDALSICIMLFFSLQTLHSAAKAQHDHSQHHTRFAWLAVTGAFILAELGDKTMFTAANLALLYNPYLVWIGGTAGLIVSNALALLLDKSIIHKININNLKLIGAIAFIIMTIWQTAILSCGWKEKTLIIISELLAFLLMWIWHKHHITQHRISARPSPTTMANQPLLDNLLDNPPANS